MSLRAKSRSLTPAHAESSFILRSHNAVTAAARVGAPRQPRARRSRPSPIGSKSWACFRIAFACALASCAPPGGGDGGATDASVSSDASIPAAADAIARMCLLNDACQYQTIFYSEADRCVSRALELVAAHAEVHTPEHRDHFARMLDCARTATSCDEYVRCSDYDVACSGVAQPRCDGTVRNACSTPGSNFLPRTFDCARFGGGSCEGGACTHRAGAASCDAPGDSRCDGEVRVWCRASAGAGTEIREACPTGTRCLGPSTYMGATVACYSTTPCAAPSTRCDGDTAVLCAMAEGQLLEARSDCAAAGRVCALDARGRAACVPPANECTAAVTGTSATCDGTAIRVCLEGRIQRVDCASLGRTSCVSVGGNVTCR